MNNGNVRAVLEVLLRSLEVPSQQPFSEWCCHNLVIPAGESEASGPYTFAGREYAIECVNDYGSRYLEGLTLAFGSQLGKTIIIMSGTAARLIHIPCKAIWVMPSRDLAREFSATRWIPFVDASETMRKMKPRERHKFSKGIQHIGNSLILFRGSNSPANLSSTPASLVNLDEVDKFNEGTKKETNAVDLAEQRTKSYTTFLKVRSSTPTLASSLIWEKFELGDQQRYFVQCYNCKRKILLVWDKDKTVLKLQGCESSVTWDKEAKKKDGSWDKERVLKSTRITCCHCGFHLQDQHKTWMNRSGVWAPTNPFAKPNVRSRHLPSLYSTSKQMRLGQLAVRWIELIEMGRGVQGMVNGELAEPFEGQDTKSKRFEIIVRGADPMKDSERLMGVDVQLVAPYFWAVTRDVAVNGDSRLDTWRALDSWDDVRAFQVDRGVKDEMVVVDCRHKPQEVFDNCLRFGTLVRKSYNERVHIGWMPCEGHDRDRDFKCPKTKLPRLFDVGASQLPHTKFELPKLLFNGPKLKDILASMRRQKTRIRWEVNEEANEEYWKHLDCEVKRPVPHPRTRRTVYEWVKRSDRTPNHMGDVEIMILAKSMLLRRFPWQLSIETTPKPDEPSKTPETGATPGTEAPGV